MGVGRKKASWHQAIAAVLAMFASTTSGLFYDTPEDCSWTPMPGREADSVFLTCHLSSISSKLERTNFSAIPSESTRGLRILCEESSLGRLEPDGFSTLSLLEELEIRNCALESIPVRAFNGLPNLRRLTVISGRETGVLRIEQGGLANLTNLSQLDLSEKWHTGIPTK